VLESKDLAERLKKNMREKVEREYRWSTIAQATKAVYQEALN
jgi:glycosyltransferase involved in cell wall biosynthesis